jgi:hypothetical protein
MRVFRKRPDAKHFTVELRDHRKIVRRFAGLPDRRQSEQLGVQIERLAGLRAAGLCVVILLAALLAAHRMLREAEGGRPAKPLEGSRESVMGQ